ncbi:MAG TPA: cysteine desulfurase family protein [Candidatus Baltobacteraceae bacterium]|nr:cysteine desulfurase family protein [Candidatus Baltobacteraceae bacterium]
MKNRIYLDHAATTPLHADVLAAMLPYFREAGYNASSLHAEGRRSRAGLDQARDRVAAALGVARKEITFLAGGTEADNLAILGAARANHERGRHVVSTEIEHHAVLHACDALRDEGFEVTLLPVDERGLVDPAGFASALRSDTVLASVMFANNEIGVLQPIAQLAAMARERGVLFHTDAVQGVGLVRVYPRELGVDLLSLSAHKFYGPKGVGVLYAREGVVLEPLIHGGGQEFGRRSGTENVAGVVGFAAALERAVAEQPERAARIGALRDRLEAGLRDCVDDMRVNGSGAPRLPNNSNLSFAGVDSETMLMRMDLEGIAVSAGSACTSGALEPSHVIAGLNIDPRWRQGVIRFSLGETTTEEEIDRVLELVPRIAAELRGRALL